MKVTSIFGKITLLAAILLAFIIGLFGTIRLSLRNPEVKVPDIVGKDKATAESELASLGLNLKARMTRYVPDKQPNTVLDQSPLPGATVKKGLPIAVVLARAPKEGEVPDEIASDDEDITANENGNANTGSTNSNAPAAKKPVNKNTNKNANTNNKNSNKNGNKNNNSNTANKNANSANGNKNANANSSNANKGNSNATNKNANANKGANANTGNRNRRATPEP